jgi:hypothetical protein
MDEVCVLTETAGGSNLIAGIYASRQGAVNYVIDFCGDVPGDASRFSLLALEEGATDVVSVTKPDGYRYVFVLERRGIIADR